MTRKRRDSREMGSAMADYLSAFQNVHPDEFDCLLFRAEEPVDEIIVPGEDAVGLVESNERPVTYADPVPARARKVPGSVPVVATDDAAGPDGDMDAPVILVLNVADVPTQSVVQYTEHVAGGAVREVSVYVAMSAATRAGMVKHYCIPFRLNDERRKV